MLRIQFAAVRKRLHEARIQIPPFKGVSAHRFQPAERDGRAAEVCLLRSDVRFGALRIMQRERDVFAPDRVHRDSGRHPVLTGNRIEDLFLIRPADKLARAVPCQHVGIFAFKPCEQVYEHFVVTDVRQNVRHIVHFKADFERNGLIDDKEFRQEILRIEAIGIQMEIFARLQRDRVSVPIPQFGKIVSLDGREFGDFADRHTDHDAHGIDLGIQLLSFAVLHGDRPELDLSRFSEVQLRAVYIDRGGQILRLDVFYQFAVRIRNAVGKFPVFITCIEPFDLIIIARVVCGNLGDFRPLFIRGGR